MKKVIFLSIFFCLAILSLGAKDINIKQISGDATPEVLDIFLSAEPGEGLNITFEKGTYHFYPDYALEFYRHISNHDDVVTRCAFPIIGMENVHINGNGSDFIFHGLMLPFIIEDSKNVTLENYTINWGTPFSSEGTVVAVNEEERTYDLKFSDDYPYIIRNGVIYFQKEYLEMRMGQTYYFDPEIGGIAYNTNDYSNWGAPLARRPAEAVNDKEFDYPYSFSLGESNPETRSIKEEFNYRFEQLSPGLVRVYGHSENLKLPKVGLIKVMKGPWFSNRIAPAHHARGADGFTVRNVTVWHAAGFGIIGEYCTDVTAENFKVMPPEGRMASGTSDGIQLAGTSGKILIKDCRFANQLDDGINIHPSSHTIRQILGPNKISLRFGGGRGLAAHYHDLRVGRPGDTILFSSGNAGGSAYTAIDPSSTVVLTLKSEKTINKNYKIVEFNENLPEGAKIGDKIAKIQHGPDVTIINSDFVTNRARGILLRGTTGNCVIENCTFRNDMQAILATAGSGKYVIRNNTFTDTPYGGRDSECMRVRGSGSGPHDIEITGNTFNHFNNLIMEISGVDGCTIAGNKVTNTGTYPMTDPENPAFRVSNSKNVTFSKNEYSGKAKEILEVDENSENVKYRK